MAYHEDMFSEGIDKPYTEQRYLELARIHAWQSGGIFQRVWFYVTFDCNLSCVYCVANSSPRNRRRPMSLQSFQTALDQAAGLGFLQAAITGGEPFLHPDILDMIQYSVRRVDTIVLTNGTTLDGDILTILKQLPQGRLHFQLSLDSADPMYHDRQRGAGSWRSTVHALSMLLEMGFDVAIRTTVTGQTKMELEKIEPFLAAQGLPAGKSYSLPVARGGRSPMGMVLEEEDLQPEPAVAADGVYRHPLKIATSAAIAPAQTPLALVVQQLAHEVDTGRPRQGYR